MPRPSLSNSNKIFWQIWYRATTCCTKKNNIVDWQAKRRGGRCNFSFNYCLIQRLALLLWLQHKNLLCIMFLPSIYEDVLNYFRICHKLVDWGLVQMGNISKSWLHLILGDSLIYIGRRQLIRDHKLERLLADLIQL